MGLLDKFFGKNKIDEAVEGLDATIRLLHMVIFNYLTKNIYSSDYSKEEAASWAMAALNTAILAQPGNENARVFYEKNEEKIWQKAKQMKKYPELSGPNGAISYLIFARQFSLEAIRNNPQTTRSKKAECAQKIWEYEERAKQLGIDTLSLRQISNSDNPIDIIEDICAKANLFIRKSMS